MRTATLATAVACGFLLSWLHPSILLIGFLAAIGVVVSDPANSID